MTKQTTPARTYLKCTAVVLLLLQSSAVLSQPKLLTDKELPDITILSTMVASFLGEGEWGFSALLEFPDQTILFDTGFKAHTVKDNAALLGKDLSRVSTVVLTHFHTDHTGGLLTLRRAFMTEHPQAFSKVYVAQGFFQQRYRSDGSAIYSLPNPGFTEVFTTPEDFRKAAEALGITFVLVDAPMELLPGLVLTGPIERVHDEKNVSGSFFLKDKAGQLLADTIPESQALGLNTPSGWLLISGCGHAGIVNAAEKLRGIKQQPVHMAVGGFHLFQADDEVIDWTAAALQRFGVEKFVGAHCTGAYATRKLADYLGLERNAVSIGAIGTRIDASLNIVPSSIE